MILWGAVYILLLYTYFTFVVKISGVALIYSSYCSIEAKILRSHRSCCHRVYLESKLFQLCNLANMKQLYLVQNICCTLNNLVQTIQHKDKVTTNIMRDKNPHYWEQEDKVDEQGRGRAQLACRKPRIFFLPIFKKNSLFTAAFFIANSPLSFKLEGGKRMVTSSPVKEPLSAILLIFVSNNFQ